MILLLWVWILCDRLCCLPEGLLRCGVDIIQFRGFRLEYCVVLRGGLGAYFT